MTASDPIIEAARDFVDGSLDDIRRAIVGAPADALNRRPAGEDTNAVAVLVVHAVSSTRWWVSLALGVALPERDRDAEFLTQVTDADALLGIVDPIAVDCRSLLDTDVPFDAGAIRENPRNGERVTAAWALLHAVEHLREHVAHAELTKQVFERPV